SAPASGPGSLASPASAFAKPAASAAAVVRNQTSALVREYHGLLGAWNFMEFLFPLTSKPSGAEPSASGATESGPNSPSAAGDAVASTAASSATGVSAVSTAGVSV